MARRIALLLISDGRWDYFRQTMASVVKMVSPIFDSVVHVDDSAHELGFAGAIQEGWRQVLETDCEFVFHVEQDFTFNQPVDLSDLAQLLLEQPHLAQIAGRRQAVGAEIPHGGFMEMAANRYSEHTDGKRHWVETDRNWTTNPSLYRTELCEVGWPDAPDSEGHFGFKLREQGLPWGVPGDRVRFGFWGSMESGRESITHIGDERTGHSY